jgi:ATP-dependent DNA ligase
LIKILKSRTPSKIKQVENHVVHNMRQVMNLVSQWMKRGDEGGVLKDASNIFIDHTSPTQLKVKLIIDADVRCTGFYEGTPGTKREKTFGGIEYTTDDGKIKGRTSGFTDKQLKEFNSKRDDLIGKIFTIEFNDITKSRDSDTYALSHPRFIEWRNDKTESDSLERVQEMKKMAMEIGGE